MKKVYILGSTGSIGKNTLKVIDEHSHSFKVVGITSNKNIELTFEQVKKYHPKFVVIANEHLYKDFKDTCPAGTKCYKGNEGLLNSLEEEEYDILVNALVGFAGLAPTITAIKRNKKICIANKESIVVGGGLINKLLKKHSATIVPIDSEHSALLHLLRHRKASEINKLILTASGGPFRGFTKEELKHVTTQMTLKHPTWDMGAKITVDSATLLNKGFEVIEAHNLFDFAFAKIDVIIHKESIIHSLLETIDGEIYAQLGPNDMKFPIQNSLTYPDLMCNSFERLKLSKIKSLSFEEPDFNNFPLLKIAYECGEKGGTYPTVLNGTNEMAVSAFLREKINFFQIHEMIIEALNSHNNIPYPTLENIYEVDKWSRDWSLKYLNNF